MYKSYLLSRYIDFRNNVILSIGALRCIPLEVRSNTRASPGFDGIGSTRASHNSRRTILSLLCRNQYEEIPPDVPPNVQRSAHDVSSKSIYTCSFFIYL